MPILCEYITLSNSFAIYSTPVGLESQGATLLVKATTL